MNNKAILGIFRPSFFMENEFFKPTHPTKVQKIPYFFVGFPNKNPSNKKTEQTAINALNKHSNFLRQRSHE